MTLDSRLSTLDFRLPTRPVAIVGGGPAGASAALELTRLGIETLLLERSDGSGNPLGECLAPSASPLLRRLGIDDVLLASGALPSYANRSAWGGHGKLADRDFLRDPHGHGWHLDRPRFNLALLDTVERAGVRLWRQTRVVEIDRVKGGWDIAVETPRGRRRVRVAMLVDATGRAAVVARRQGARRRAFDRQVAASAILAQCPGTDPFADATTVVEATESGWWYAALLPDGRLSVAWFTEPDLLARSVAWNGEAWWAALRSSTLIWNVASRHGYRAPGEVRVAPAGSSILTRPGGDGWIAAGDAAAAFDPLSSHGIGSALASGRQAARVVAATLGGDETAVAAYTDRVLAAYAQYLWTRHAYYADERRWPDAPFWARRHHNQPCRGSHETKSPSPIAMGEGLG